jgi:hypothetical protein
MRRHPRFRTARKLYRALPNRFAALQTQGTLMAVEWARAIEKDDTGLQCVRLVDDVIERNSELKW